MRHLPLFLAAFLAASPAFAENRGVVISNGRYENAPPLADADATAAAEAMKAAGFRTVAGRDLMIGDVRQAVSDLLRPDDTPGARMIVLNGRFIHGSRDSWYLGVDADKPDPVSAGSQGVSLETVMDLLKDADPGAVVLLGFDDQGIDHAAGLDNGPGALTPPEGVTLISGPPAAIAEAGKALLTPGTSVGDLLKADSRLVMAEGGNSALVLIENVSSDAGAGQGALSSPATATESDRDLWAKAAATDTVEAYQSYLSQYPTGLYSAAASARLGKLGVSTKSDRDLWAESAASNTAVAYEAYLSNYPKGEFSDAAQKRLLELRLAEDAAAAAPASPVKSPTRPEIQQPRPVTPRPQPDPGQTAEQQLGLSRANRVTIQRRLNLLGYSTGGTDGVFGARSRSAIRGFQQRNGFPVTGYLTANQIGVLNDQAGSLAQTAETEDRAYWQRTGAKGGANNLRAYLDRYPSGIYAQAARNRLAELEGVDPYLGREDQAWAQARRADSVQAYNAYLQSFPRGQHAKQAQQRRDRLIREGQLGGGLGGGLGGNLGNGVGGITPEAIIRELLK